MLSSTLALAAAANYPAPFVKNGAADVAVVYGANAANSDLVAANDVTRLLQLELSKQTATSSGSGSSTTSVSGADFVALKKSSDNLNLGNVVATVFGATVTDDDLTELLADGVYRNDENTDYDYEQKVTLGNSLILSYFSDNDYKDEAPTIGINLTSSQEVLNYTIDFTTDAESDLSGSDLVDLETTNLRLFGKDYYILDAKNNTVKLTLLDTANSAIVSQGETKTITQGDKSYEASIVYISTSEVKLTVNGETTNSLSEGETYKLSDGTYLGIKDILARDVAGDVGQVEFSIGSGKLELTNGQTIELNDDTVDEITSYITTSASSSTRYKLDKIVLRWTTDDDEFITAENELVMPGFNALKLSMGAFSLPSQEETQVIGGSDRIELKTTIKDGEVTIPLLYAASAASQFSGIGKDATNKLVTSNETSAINFSVASDQYMIASWNSSSEAESYLLSFDVNKVDGINRTDVTKHAGGSSTAVCKDKAPTDTCNIGSLTLTISSVLENGANDVVMIQGGSGSSFNNLYTATGLKIALPTFAHNATTYDGSINLTGTGATAGHTNTTFTLFFDEENKDDNLGAGPSFNVSIAFNTDTDIQVSAVDTQETNHDVSGDDDDTTSRVNSDLATQVIRIVKSGSPSDAKVIYSGSEAYGDVILTAVGATVSSDGTTTTTTGTGVKDLGSVQVSDSEVSSVSSKNLVVVGGSCINAVAAKLLGGSLCGADFTTKTDVGAGAFLIQAFTSPYANNKIAVLVAGYNAGDTTNAAKYLTTNKVDVEKVGTKFKGTSATQASMVTTTSDTTTG